MLSITSTDEGPCFSTSTIASLACTMSEKCSMDSAVMVGRGTRLTLASVTTHSVPSDPTTMRVMLKGSSLRNSSRL